ncbi:MAG: single-stranded-DNA-specific exonuclease RecJ [Candidatus Omnitrophica bacterium]|nr:single-stranded-DNA-specific exonuclease RecJ [Candidatus Omnitrophota bacterium]
MSSHKILKIAKPDPSLQNTLSRKLRISTILAQVLINRNLADPNEAQKFLNISTDNFLDPLSFPDMQKAVSLVKKAAKNKDKVLIFGDYDVDGITAAALLKETLAKLGIKALHYLPHRIKEGYGLTKNIAQAAKEMRVKLLITVDCGISNHARVEELKRAGIETIITDHHEPATDKLPEAAAILNPKIKNSGYKFRELAGVGVAYKFCQALAGSTLSEELDLVSLGTIADSVPLIGENRIIAREGLKQLPQTKRPGLRVLIENAGIQDKEFTSTYVSFILAPRLNASGRMDTAETSLKLLLSDNMDEAEELAEALEGYNRQRQKVEGKIFEEAQDLINREVNFKEHKVIVIAKEDWHHGVLGIVASKLADMFYRPAIVISVNDGVCKGSARSTKNFHLFDALFECRGFLDSFGGHAHAAGLLITKDSIRDFRDNINRLAHEKMSLEDLLPSLDVDMELGFKDLNGQVIEELELLEPFGAGNPEPLFYTRNLRLKGEPQTLARETLKFWVTDGDLTYQAIGFGMSGFKESLLSADSFEMIYSPRMDSWRGLDSVILEAKDIILR